MRMLPLSAAALCLALTVPAVAQEAGDCDMVCRLKGYLSTDHMAGNPSDDAPAAAPVKAHRARAAGLHRAAAAQAKPAATKTVAVAASRQRAPEARALAKPKAQPAAPVRAVTMVPARTVEPVSAPARHATPVAAEAIATALPPKVPVRPSPAGHRAPAAAVATTTTTTPVPMRIAPERHAAAPRPARPEAPTRTASLAAIIPGSSPAMQAGFH